MKKKIIERQSEKRLERINELEFLLGKRKEQIRELKEEVEGYKQVTTILQAFIAEGIEKKGEVHIPITSLSEGLRLGYKFDIRDNEYVITKSDIKIHE